MRVHKLPSVRSPRLPSVRSPVWVLVASFLFTVLLAAGANLTIELWQLDGDSEAWANSSLTEHLMLFWLGTLVIWLLVILVLALVGRLWVTAGLVAIATLTTGYANHEKLELRLEPLYPSDLAMASQLDFLSQMVGLSATLALVGGLVLAVALAVLGGHFATKLFPRIRRTSHPRLAIGLLVTRVCTVLVVLLGLFYVTDFNNPGNQFRAAYEDQGARWRFWNQHTNYRSNGFVGGMLYNTDVPGMIRPVGYSEATMRALTEKYAESAAVINEQRDPDAFDGVNVVMVLSETFTDPTRLKTVEVAEDPIPYTRSLMRRTTSGNMLAARFGGGTANMEFSALTGMSLALFQPQMNTPYQMLVPDYEQFPSLAGYFGQLGHRTAATHPFLPSLYRRSEVYPILGFETSEFADEMAHQERLENSEYISDESAFQEVGDTIADASEPVFVNLVTMQNHMLMAGSYSDPIPVTGVEEGDGRDNAEHYARGLSYSDEALQRFIESMNSSGEKTVLLFYGDHLPGFWPTEVRRANGIRTMRETPFFVYANFGDQQARQLPTTSPAYFGNHIFEAAGAAVPPYYALLTQLEQEIPAMEQDMMIGTDDREITDGDLSSKARELLHDYRLVQYDLSVGQRWSQSEMLYPEQTSLAASD